MKAKRDGWKWILLVCLCGSLIGLFIQSQVISDLKDQNEILFSRLTAKKQAPQENKSVDSEQRELEQLRKDKKELVRLRNDVGHLQHELAATKTDSAPPQKLNSPNIAGSAKSANPIQQLAASASAGDLEALK